MTQGVYALRIIVIEDEVAARRGLVRLLEDFQESGVQVVGQASDGQQGLQQIRALSPDVAFVDIKMPGMDGLEMIRQAREQGFMTTFVVVSAFTEFDYARQAMRLSVNEYLVKPITVEDVESVLSHLLPRFVGAEIMGVRHPMVQKASQLIHEQYGNHINLSNTAESLNITPEYLSYLFHRDMGVNFSTYLRNYRIGKACELMKDGNAKIYEIAHACGFSDAKYFCRVFREVTGRPPGVYIKEQEPE